MIRLRRWLRWQSAVGEAKAQLEKAQAEKAIAHRLSNEVRAEDRITARMHEAMRGGRA